MEDATRREKARSRSISIDVSDTVHLEALIAKPRRSQTPVAPIAPSWGGESAGQSATGPRLNPAKVGIVLTHPHPLLGGNLHNNVVVSLFQRFAAEGFCVVRFNFRGTGRSSGSRTWRGSGEREDVIAVCRYLQSDCGVEAVYLIGYSYGSAIACSVVNDVDIVKGCIAVSYPFGVLTWILLGHLLNRAKTEKPSLWVIGTEDNFTSVARFRNSVQALALLGLADEEELGKKKRKTTNRWNMYTMDYFKRRLQTTAVIHDMDHFWFDDEDILADVCMAWIHARLEDEEGNSDQPDRLPQHAVDDSHSKL